MDSEERPPFVATDRQRALLQLLIEAGIRESDAEANGRRFEDRPPVALAMLLDTALDAQASSDQLLGILTWGREELATPALRKLTLKIAALSEIPSA
jgi:hypothetical protein